MRRKSWCETAAPLATCLPNLSHRENHWKRAPSSVKGLIGVGFKRYRMVMSCTVRTRGPKLTLCHTSTNQTLEKEWQGTSLRRICARLQWSRLLLMWQILLNRYFDFAHLELTTSQLICQDYLQKWHHAKPFYFPNAFLEQDIPSVSSNNCRKMLPSRAGLRSLQSKGCSVLGTNSAMSALSTSNSALLHTSPVSPPTGTQESPSPQSNKHVTRKNSRGFTSLNEKTPYQLCFLRHGQSTWNRDNRFIGWTDTPLTEDGVLEARVAGQMLARSGVKFDEVHTSLLRRCIRTTNLVLMELGQEYIPVNKNWRLNERCVLISSSFWMFLIQMCQWKFLTIWLTLDFPKRHYGNLVGKNKKEIVKIHGKEKVRRWRRSWDDPPPPMEVSHEFHPALDPRYRDVSHFC